MKLSKRIFSSLLRTPSLSSAIFSRHAVPTTFHSRIWVKKMVSMICVQGCNLSDSSIHPNAVILHLTKQSNDPRLVDQDYSLRILQNCKSSYLHHKKFISRTILVHNILSVSSNTHTSDGRGGSQSAEEMQHRLSYIYNIQSSNTHIVQQNIAAVHNQINSDNYISRLLSTLLMWKIQMIVCLGPIPAEIIDLCAEHHIIILPCTLRGLSQLSHLLQTESIEDPLDIIEETVSNQKYQILIDIEETVRIIDNEDGVQEGASLYSQQESTLYILTITDNSSSVHQESSPLPEYYPHTSVILRCPSAIVGYNLYHRIYRCLSRISHLICRNNDYCGNITSANRDTEGFSSPELMCGGGLVELICAMEISSQLSKSHQFFPFLHSFQYIFETYVRIINENNGADHELCLQYWEQSKISLLSTISQSHSTSTGTFINSNFLQQITELSSSIKWKLISPIQINNTCLSVANTQDPSQTSSSFHELHPSPTLPPPPLDIYSLKVNAMKIAIYTIKLIFNTHNNMIK